MAPRIIKSVYNKANEVECFFLKPCDYCIKSHTSQDIESSDYTPLFLEILKRLVRLIQVYNQKVNFYRQTYIEEPHEPISFKQGQYPS